MSSSTMERASENLLLVRTVTVLGLGEIPAGEVLLRKTSLEEQVAGTGTASTKGAQDESSRLTSQLLLAFRKILANLLNELVLVQVVASAVGECGDGGELLAGVSELPGPSLDTKSSAGETCMIAKSCKENE